jgi:hypothetical protein
MLRVSRQEQSAASNNVGLMSMRIGEQETSRKRTMFISVQTGFISTFRSDDAKQCILVIIVLTSGGKKEFLAIEDGYRESKQIWTEVLLSLKDRGFRSSKLAVGDGALGFWKAVRKFFLKPVANVAGFIRRQTFSTSSQNTVRQKQNNISMISGWRKPEKMQRRRSTYSLKLMNSSIQKRSSVLKKIERNS